MSTVGRWHRWLRWIDWIRTDWPSSKLLPRFVTVHQTRAAATYRRKACLPVPCPPFVNVRFDDVEVIPWEKIPRVVDVHLPPETL